VFSAFAYAAFIFINLGVLAAMVILERAPALVGAATSAEVRPSRRTRAAKRPVGFLPFSEDGE
jgi:hypothetical protein